MSNLLANLKSISVEGEQLNIILQNQNEKKDNIWKFDIFLQNQTSRLKQLDLNPGGQIKSKKTYSNEI